MNLTIYKMELSRNFKSFLIWSLSLCGILFFGMLFYPAITADGLLMEMEELFENPMMKTMLAAFGADIYSMSSLMGFYVTYNSIYNVLLGCIFAAVLAGNLLAREESDKTAEFLFTRPVSRQSIFISKSAVLVTYIFLLSLLFFLTSLLALETVKKDSPRLLHLSQTEKNLIVQQIETHPDAIYEAFNLNEKSFADYSLSYASGLLTSNVSEVEAMDFDIKDLEKLIEEAKDSPEDFFESVLNSPEDYMKLFNVPPEKREEFLENVRGEQEEYFAMKEQFFQDPELFLMFFREDAGKALNQFAPEPGSMARTIDLLDLPENMEEKIFKKYSASTLLVLCAYIFLLINSIGALVLFLSLLVKRGRSVLGAALALVFVFYFLNSMAEMGSALSPLVRAIGFISPFTWMDSDFSVPAYGLTWWRVLLFASLWGLSMFAAQLVFRRKDILV